MAHLQVPRQNQTSSQSEFLDHFLHMHTDVGYAPLLVGVRFLLERCFGLLIHSSPLLAQHLADFGDLHVRVLGFDLVM